MVEIVCAVLAGISTVICAFITSTNAKKQKRSDQRILQRAKESHLLLEMIHASIKLAVGTALAIKNNHANGELEEGLRAVEKAESAYQEFVEEIAIDHLSRK